MKEDLTRWKKFWKIVTDPWVIVFFILTLLLAGLTTHPEIKNSNWLSIFFTILIGIVTGILGGLITKQMEDLTTNDAIRSRGQLAIRSLKLLKNNIASLERRVIDFLGKIDDELQKKVISRNYEEIIEKCCTLQEGATHSIETWLDIVPDVKTEVGDITNLKFNLKIEQDKLKKLEEENEKLQELSLEEKQNSQEKINLHKKKIEKLEKEVDSYQRNSLFGFSSDSPYPRLQPSSDILGSSQLYPSDTKLPWDSNNVEK